MWWGEHAESYQLLGVVEDHGEEPGGHFGIEFDFDPSLYIVLVFDEQVEELAGVEHGLAVVCHETDEGRVPLVGNFGKGGGSGDMRIWHMRLSKAWTA